MMPPTRFLRTTASVLCVLAAAACFQVRITKDSRGIEARFRRADREIARLQAASKDRPRRPHSLCLLAFDRQDRQLVEIRTSLAFLRMILSSGAGADEAEADSSLRRNYGLDWRLLLKEDAFPPGLLLDLEDEETRVLIWLK